MTPKRLTFYALLIASVLLLFVLFAYQQLASAREGVLQSTEDLKNCRLLAARIGSLQDSSAGPQLMQQTELDKQMETAAQAAGFSVHALATIIPDRPHQVSASVYDQSTDVLLQEVTLPQLVDFLYHLSVKNAGLRITALRLTAPRDPSQIGRWTTHVTVNYRFYSSKTLQGVP